MTRSQRTIVVAICLLLATAGASLGAGFEIAEQSGRLLGSAYAGKAAEASDASTVFFNPAGLMRLDNFQAAMSVHLLWTQGRFDDDGSTGNLGAPRGSNGNNIGGLNWIPATYVAVPITEKFTAGFGLNAPFGLTTEFEDGWKGRYHALKSQLQTINLNPSLAYRINEMFSVGAGLNVQWASAELTNAIDFGSIAYARLGAPTAGALGFVPEGQDGEAKVVGDSWGYGFNAGVLVELSPQTRIGLSYRSSIDHTLEGDGKFDVPAEATILTSTGAFRNVDVEADVTLPEQVYLSAYHELNDQWALMADVTWTAWSQFEELRIEFDNPAQPDAVTKEKWDDVFRYSLGCIFRPDQFMTLRAGVAFDESPISDKYRTPRIPSNDRIWATFGLGYKLGETAYLDVTYLHVFINDGDLDQVASTGQRLKGTFEGSADVLGLSLTIGF